jgi:hypothetical protein
MTVNLANTMIREFIKAFNWPSSLSTASRTAARSACSPTQYSVSNGSSNETTGTTLLLRPSDATQASSKHPCNLVPAESILVALIAVAVILFMGQPASWLSSSTLLLSLREAADIIFVQGACHRVSSPPSRSVRVCTPANRRFFPSYLPFSSFAMFCPWMDLFPMNARMAISTLHGSCAWSAAIMQPRSTYGQLVNYLQEVIPAMDQVLKNSMLELAEEDQAEGLEGMVGQEGKEEIAEIMSKVYKVRPFGLPAINMRSLNPQGKVIISHLNVVWLWGLNCSARHGQTRLYQGSSHLSNSCHSWYESRLFPLPHM